MPCPICNGFAAESDEFAACGCGTKKDSEEEAYSYAYNEGHADARKREPYKPNLTSKGTKDFNRVVKQRAESFEADRGWPHYVCKKNKKTYKRTKIHPSWGEFGYPNAVCWNCMGYECVAEMLKGYAERGLSPRSGVYSYKAEWSEIDEAHALLRRKDKKARDLARKAARRNKQIRYQMGAEGMEMTPDIEGYPGLPVVPDH